MARLSWMVIATSLLVTPVCQGDEIDSRLLVTDGVCEPLDSSPAGLALFYDQAGDFGGICAIESGVEYKPFVIYGSKVGIGQTQPVAVLHISRDAQSTVFSYGQVRVTPATGNTNRGLALGFADAKGFLQAEDPGNAFLPLVLNPSGGAVAALQGLTLKAPDGHCAVLTLANDNSLVVTTVTCP